MITEKDIAAAEAALDAMKDDALIPPTLHHQCAWCFDWLDSHGNVIPKPAHANPKQVSHGICRACLQRAKGKV